MAGCFPVARRLLLAQVGSGVFGTFLLPAALHQAMAKPAARVAAARQPAPGQAPQSAPLVMLDPGHGGKDPGAIGVSGTYEKHVALSTAMELQRQLTAGGHYRVALTRARDVFIPLDERVARAQERGASLFVSMHADALNDHEVRGASVYTLSNTASDAQTGSKARGFAPGPHQGALPLGSPPRAAALGTRRWLG
jgi:N-acetylmuramoyl-L-alanine amidase